MNAVMCFRIGLTFCVAAAIFCLGAFIVVGRPLMLACFGICVCSSLSVWCSLQAEKRS
jgi:hypothetical protein